MKGLDFSVPPPAAALARFAADLRREGFGFVVRYLSADPAKNLTRDEVAAYRNAGLDIVTVYEDAAEWMLGGSTAGHAAAKLAARQLDDLSAPPHAPVLFAVDFAPDAAQMPLVDACLDATAYVLTDACNGIYGPYAAVSKAAYVRYRWQTAAWSAGKWDPSDQMRQYAQGGVTDGVQWDLDVSLPQFADFGQWQFPAPARHAAPVKPKAKPVRTAVKKTTAATAKTVAKEPAVTAYGTAGALSAAVAVVAVHLGIHLTATQLHATLTALPALAALFTAARTRPVATAVITGALVTISTAALAFGTTAGPSLFGWAIPAAAAALAALQRGTQTPVTTATAAGLQAVLADAAHQAAALNP